MGGPLGLLAGIVGVIGLGFMISNLKTDAFDPLGGIIFGVMVLNGIWVVWKRMTGREDSGKKGPFSR